MRALAKFFASQQLTQILGQKVTPEVTYFSQEKDENIAEYQKIFGDNIFFTKDENAIFFKQNLDV